MDSLQYDTKFTHDIKQYKISTKYKPSASHSSLKIYALNVGGLATKFDIGILDNIAEHYDILCFTETKTSFIENFQFNEFKSVSLPIKNANYRFGGVHGIAVYFRESLCDYIEINVENILTDSILLCNINCKDRNLSFVLGILYVPYDGSKYYRKDFFDNLAIDIANIQSKYDKCMLVGDFNARTGMLDDFVEVDDSIEELCLMDDYEWTNIFHEYGIPLNRSNEDKVVNKNGRDLIKLCQITELKILNGRIGNDRGKGSFTCTTGMGNSTIDYAIGSPSMISLVQDLKVEPFDRLVSDTHCALSISIRSSIGTNENCITHTSLANDCQQLSLKLVWDEDIKVDFINNFDQIEINKLDDEISKARDSDLTPTVIDDIYQNIKNLFFKASRSSNLCKNTKKNTNKELKTKDTKSKPWFDQECYNLRSEYLKLKNKMHRVKTLDIRNVTNEKGKQLKTLIKKKKRDYQANLNTFLREHRYENPKEFWKIINPKDKGSDCKVSIEEFVTHFKNLGQTQDTIREQQINPEPDLYNTNDNINHQFTVEEIKSHIRKLKSNKSAGYDRIINENLKNCPESLIILITRYFNLVLDSGIVPEDWCLAMIQPIYKNKGSKLDPDNYRGISLLSCIGKLFSSCINTRLSNYLEICGILQENQIGFRNTYSTLDHIFTLNSILELYLSQNKRIYAAFVDYSKAFDLIDRCSLWRKLLDNEINGKIFSVIHNMYNKSKSCVKLGNDISTFFSFKSGVKQGDIFEPPSICNLSK